jgi:hypothetical protein
MGIKFNFKFLYLAFIFSSNFLFTNEAGNRVVFFQLTFNKDTEWVGFNLVFLPILIQIGLPRSKTLEVED